MIILLMRAPDTTLGLVARNNYRFARHPGAMRGPNRKLVYTARLIVTDARSSYRAVSDVRTAQYFEGTWTYGRHQILLPFPEQVARD